MTDTVTNVPPGAFVLDCTPHGPPKLLRVDPATLTPARRLAICTGGLTLNVDPELHPDLEIKQGPGGALEVAPRSK